MNEFLDSLKSPSWWIGVVVVGIIINLISDPLRRRLEKFASKFSERRRTEISKRMADRENFINALKTDSTKQIHLAQYINIRQNESLIFATFTTYFFLLILILFVISEDLKSTLGFAIMEIFFILMAGFTILIFLNESRKADKARRILKEIQDEKFFTDLLK